MSPWSIHLAWPLTNYVVQSLISRFGWPAINVLLLNFNIIVHASPLMMNSTYIMLTAVNVFYNKMCALKGTSCLGSVELVFEKRSVTVCYKMYRVRKILLKQNILIDTNMPRNCVVFFVPRRLTRSAIYGGQIFDSHKIGRPCQFAT